MATAPSVGDKVVTDFYDDFFTELEELRQKVYEKEANTNYASSFTKDPNLVQGEPVQATTPTLIKQYIQRLEASRFIAAGTSNDITVPGSASLIEISQYPVKSQQVLTALQSACLNDASNFSGFNGANFSGFKGSNFGGFNGFNFGGFDSFNFAGFCDNCFWEQTFNGFSGRGC